MKTVFTAFILFISIFTSSVYAGYQDIWVAPANSSESIFNEAVTGGLANTFPGLKVRIA